MSHGHEPPFIDWIKSVYISTEPYLHLKLPSAKAETTSTAKKYRIQVWKKNQRRPKHDYFEDFASQTFVAFSSCNSWKKYSADATSSWLLNYSTL
jgi:hypothetical protein